MKKKFILLPFIGVLAYVIFSSDAEGPGAAGLGDRTGASTGIAAGCSSPGSSCHATSATATTTIGIQLYNGATLVTGGYTGGTAYTIRITGTQTSASTTLPRFGFQVAVGKTGTVGTNEGTLYAITGAHMGTYSGINIVEQSAAMAATTGTGATGTTYVLNIPWTAPAAGTGSVTVYTVLNAVNDNGVQDPGDLWNTNTLAIPEAIVSGVGAIAGTLAVCEGATTSLSDATTGGTWSSSATTIATVGATGTAGGVAPGTATVTYTVTGIGSATAIVTVNTMPAPAAIAGSNVVCVGVHTDLTDPTSGGVWSSTATTIATAGSSSGIVYGVAVGTDSIKYTITNACGSVHVSHEMTVRAFGSGYCGSGVKGQSATQTVLKVFPNPNRGMFTMNLLGGNDEPAHVVITTMWGITVKEYNTTTNYEHEVMLKQPAGIYFVTATTMDGMYEAKIVVQ